MSKTVDYEKKNERMARYSAIIYAVLLIALLFIIGFRAPFPMPGEEGVLINFGTVESASGNNAPKAEQIQEVSESQPVSEAIDAPIEDVLTENTSDNIKIEEKPKEVETKPKTEPKEEKPKTESVEEKPEVNENALFSGTPQGNTNNGSQGIGNGQGDMGQPDGSQNSDNYVGNNSGLGNNGIGYDLSGRVMTVIPKIRDKSQKEGKVRLKIKVNASGKVISAEYTALGSSTSDAYLVSLAKKAATEAKFNASDAAGQVQSGTMTFTFKLR